MRKGGQDAELCTATITELDDRGSGVARVGSKVVFVDGALPGETVRFLVTKRRSRFDQAQLVHVDSPSPHRVKPRCPHFGLCGGCSLQHLDQAQQVAFKQRHLLDQLQTSAGVSPLRVLPALTGHVWGYRRKARLGVKHVPKKGGALVGFRERNDHRIAQLERCEILPGEVGSAIRALRDLVSGLDVNNKIPQIEVAVGDPGTDAEQRVALVVRHLVSLPESDRETLCDFARTRGFQLYLQPGGLDTIACVWPEQPSPLSYRIPDYGLEFEFMPSDFIQVNAEINRALVHQAVELLAPDSSDTVLDLFCGIGNFSLALSRHAGEVIGVEGLDTLVQRARHNARLNAVANVRFETADLADAQSCAFWLGQSCSKLFLDPPRSGAREVVRQLREPYPGQILYVSCNPATLARDAADLAALHGYRLLACGVVDMFPHTSHVEAIAFFERPATA